MKDTACIPITEDEIKKMVEPKNFDKAEISCHKIVIKYKSWKFIISHDKHEPWMIISWCNDFWVLIENNISENTMCCKKRFPTWDTALDFVKDFINNELQ